MKSESSPLSIPDRSNPWLALLLSTILPGSGQLYNRETKKGWAIIGSCLALGLLFYGLVGFNRISLALALLLLWFSAIADAYKVATTSGRASEFYYRRRYVVAMLLFVGPLALPLLWQSPHFSRTARWTWTVIVVGAVLLFVATPYLMRWLIEQPRRQVAKKISEQLPVSCQWPLSKSASPSFHHSGGERE